MIVRIIDFLLINKKAANALIIYIHSRIRGNIKLRKAKRIILPV